MYFWMMCLTIASVLFADSSIEKSYSVKTSQYTKLKLPRVLLRCVQNLGNEDLCLRDAYDEFAKRVIWNMKVIGIDCVESSKTGVDYDLNDNNTLSVTVDIKSVHHKITLGLQITDKHGIIKDQVFVVEPGEWYCEIPRLISDTIASTVFAKSSVFSTPIFTVIKREEDGRQEIVRTYMDGIDSSSVGISYREIFSVNSFESGLIYTALEYSNFVVKKLINNKVIDIDITNGYSLYDFDVRYNRVAFTRMNEDGVCELGIVGNTNALLSTNDTSDDYDFQVLHSAKFCKMISPSISPSGKRIAFLSDEHVLKTMSVYVYDLESKRLNRITQQNIVEVVQWCPANESMIAVLIQNDDKTYKVCILDQKGVVLRSSSTIECPLSMKWNCDGSGLLLCVAKSDKNASTLYSLSLQTMELHQIGVPENEYLFAVM